MNLSFRTRTLARATRAFAMASARQSSLSMEGAFEAACASQVIPGAVLMAGDISGRLTT